jgi:AraC-like DNA-binding protein
MALTDCRQITEMARWNLSGGDLDALSAVHFSRRFPPHFHDTFAIGVVESGETRLRTRRGVWDARAGTILAFSPGEIHSAEPLSSPGFTYRMVYPTAQFMREIGIRIQPGDADRPLFRSPVIHDRDLGAALARSHAPLMEGATTRSAESRLVMNLRALVARYGTDGGESAELGADWRIVSAARAYLMSRFAQQVRLETIAEVCGTNKFQLIRVFQRVLGVPPYAYLLQLRLNVARSMLSRGVRISDVAYSCGFSDQSHLTRLFKTAVGVPPGKYVQATRAPAGQSDSRLGVAPRAL